MNKKLYLVHMGYGIPTLTQYQPVCERAGYTGGPASAQITGVGPGGTKKLQIQYRALMCQTDGLLAEFRVEWIG